MLRRFSPCSAFCFDRLFLTTHAFLVPLSRSSRNVSFLPFSSLPCFFPFLLLRVTGSSLFAARYTPLPNVLPLLPLFSLLRSLSLDTVYKPQPTPSSRRTFFESYCTMRFEWCGVWRERKKRRRARSPIVVSPMAADFIVI